MRSSILSLLTRMRSLFCIPLIVLTLGALAVGCIPADQAQQLGSVQFTFIASQRTANGVIADETEDHWSLKFDRIILGFKTMTIGKIGVADLCSYRGRGAIADAVFDPRIGLIQTFNGIQPVECPDVGVIFGSPSNTTVLADGVASSDLLDLATNGTPAHGIVEVTATNDNYFDDLTQTIRTFTLKINLRFDSALTSTRFGGCREAYRGVRILSNTRDEAVVRFAGENLFREAISTTTGFRTQPFFDADQNLLYGNKDGIVTMDELEKEPLAGIGYGVYQLPDGTQAGTFADYVRALFRFTLMFRTELGGCIGNAPGSTDDTTNP